MEAQAYGCPREAVGVRPGPLGTWISVPWPSVMHTKPLTSPYALPLTDCYHIGKLSLIDMKSHVHVYPASDGQKPGLFPVQHCTELREALLMHTSSML